MIRNGEVVVQAGYKIKENIDFLESVKILDGELKSATRRNSIPRLETIGSKIGILKLFIHSRILFMHLAMALYFSLIFGWFHHQIIEKSAPIWIVLSRYPLQNIDFQKYSSIHASWNVLFYFYFWDVSKKIWFIRCWSILSTLYF